MTDAAGPPAVSGETFAVIVTLRDLVRDIAEHCAPQVAAHPDEARALFQSVGALVVRLQATEADWGDPEKWKFHKGRLSRIRERMETDLTDFLAVCTGDGAAVPGGRA
ncbi:MAG: hypothetical protein ACRDOU_32705 [Streptosporangiaceae bacterium]